MITSYFCGKEVTLSYFVECNKRAVSLLPKNLSLDSDMAYHYWHESISSFDNNTDICEGATDTMVISVVSVRTLLSTVLRYSCVTQHKQ